MTELAARDLRNLPDSRPASAVLGLLLDLVRLDPVGPHPDLAFTRLRQVLAAHLPLQRAVAYVGDRDLLVTHQAWSADGTLPPAADVAAATAALRAGVLGRHAGGRGLAIPLLHDGDAIGALTVTLEAPPDHHAVAALEAAAATFSRSLAWAGRLALQDELESRFIARAGHQLRTPIATLGVTATTLATRHERLGEEQRATLATDIERDVELLARCLGELVGAAELEAGRRWPAVAGLEVTGLVREVASRWHDRLPVGLVDTGPAWAEADDAVVRDVLQLLFEDAARRGAASAVVAVAVAPGVVVLDVGDDAPRQAPPGDEAFLAFRRGASGLTLDLGVARRLARSIGGELARLTSPPGSSRFRLSLRERAR